MNIRTLFLAKPTGPPSRRQLTIGCVGLVLLGAIVIAHAIALTVFLWAATAGRAELSPLALVWVVSVIAIVFIARGLRHNLDRMRLDASSR